MVDLNRYPAPTCERLRSYPSWRNFEIAGTLEHKKSIFGHIQRASWRLVRLATIAAMSALELRLIALVSYAHDCMFLLFYSSLGARVAKMLLNL